MKWLKLLVRRFGLIQPYDYGHYYYLLLKTRKSRAAFKRSNPGVALPPPYFIYETFNLNYSAYYQGGLETAKWLADHLSNYKKPENLNILDWGCGPGRTIRHLPGIIGDSSRFFGTDYNKEYIAWCSSNISKVSFATNDLAPPLEYPSGFFDFIYGISIFTHLSEKMHYAWFEELMRVLKPEGILLLTLHGEAFYDRLTEAEKKQFVAGDLVIKGNTKEGHRTYGAFHPVSFVRKLIGNHSLMEFVPGRNINGKPQQDLWIIRKSA